METKHSAYNLSAHLFLNVSHLDTMAGTRSGPPPPDRITGSQHLLLTADRKAIRQKQMSPGYLIDIPTKCFVDNHHRCAANGRREAGKQRGYNYN